MGDKNMSDFLMGSAVKSEANRSGIDQQEIIKQKGRGIHAGVFRA
jgi:hypothetical protein